jgi:glucose/arabinose dehydrogenase
MTVTLAIACGSGAPRDAPTEPPVDTAAARLEPVLTGLQGPVHLTAPAGDGRLFVVEQRGVIRVARSDQLLSAPFLDIRTKVRSGGEQGLLSLAFHPSYASNGFFYVNYTDLNGNTKVERYHAGANSDVADAESGKLILSVNQPFANHNGGHILFGPAGMLYVAMGDGGSGGDPQGNGQNRATLLGDLLRLDVDHGDPYVVPSDNPYVNQTQFRGEIWAWGLRNPWRIAFDPAAGLLYIADVGQNAWEEVNVVAASAKGVNYGWNIMEGTHCYASGSCSQSGLTLPVLEYGHSDGCSITGGIVYRGSRLPSLRGHYFYADYCRGWVRSFRYANGSALDQRSWSFGNIGSVTSFGQDAAGELYVVSTNGTIYRLTN